jgi:hypothetical protein
LDGDDEYDDDMDSRTDDQYQNWTIKSAFSTESDTGEYKREILYERKKATLNHQLSGSNKKRDLSAFSIKPPTKDTRAIRASADLGNSATKKKTKQKVSDQFDSLSKDSSFYSTTSSKKQDPFNQPCFASSEDGFDGILAQKKEVSSFVRGSTSVYDSSYLHADDESASRHTMSSKNTISSKQSFPHPSHQTVSSDPSDFFSKETVKLTKNNLARMAAMSGSIHENSRDEFDTYRNPPGRGKFYQFAIDEDRESTVVESNIGLNVGFGYHPEEDEVEDDDSDGEYTEYSNDVASQGTKIQERPRSQLFMSNKGCNDAKNVGCNDQGFDSFFAKSEEAKEDFFAFPENESNIMEGCDDPFFEPVPPKETIPPPPKYSRMTSANSLSYSPSPKHSKKKLQSKLTEQNTRDDRLPLSPLNNVKRLGGGKGGNKGNHLLPPSQSKTEKPDPDEAWGFQRQSSQVLEDQNDLGKPDPDSVFDAFGISEKKTSTKSKKRDPSISSGFEASNSNALSLQHGQNSWPGKKSAHQVSNHVWQEDGSMKENAGFGTMKFHGQKWNETTSNRNTGSAFSSESDGDDDSYADDDSFDPVAVWEKPGMKPMGIRSFASKRLSGGSVSSYGSRRIYDEDNKSSESRRSASGSYTKPLGLPSNAIMASMLFRTHYNIDQQDVENKLKAREEEYSKDQKSRKGDIPDAVTADNDYMSHVSSFSDETMTFQDAWRKPSRDLLDYFSKARTMEVDTKKRFERQQVKAKALFEA